jgi:HlyD family secretion protein
MANNKPKKNRKKVYIFSALGALIVILVVVIILGSNKEKIITVQTEKVKRMTITQVVEATGKIQPQTQVKINAEVSGEIVDIPVKEGDRVKRGQLLVRIKPDTYSADRDQAAATVTRAKSYLEQRESDFKKVDNDYKRAKDLFGKKLISDADYEASRNAYENAKASIDGAKSDVANSMATLARAKENLNKTSIYSPIEGVVSQLISKAGERVSGSSFMQGTEIMTVSDLSIMEARVEVNENDVIHINIGDTARVEVDAYPDSLFVATVFQIANTAKTKAAGTQEEVTNFEIRLLLHTKGVEFRPGMSSSAKIETDTRYNVLAVPLQCVTTREKKGKPGEGVDQKQASDEGAAMVSNDQKEKKKEKPEEIVFIVKDGLARKQKVKTGISSDQYIEISEGLKENIEVIKGSYRAISRELEDSTKIRVDNKMTFTAPK